MNAMTAEIARYRMDDIARDVAACRAARACRQAAVPDGIASRPRRWRRIRRTRQAYA
jgi:hypothetical protein